MGLSFLKLAPYIAIVLIVIAGFFYVKNLGKIECENNAKTVILEGVKDREKIEHENKGLEHNGIVKRLDANGWLRPE